MNRIVASVLAATLLGAVIDACSPSKPNATGLTFDKTTLDTAYRSEGVAVFDVDLDGHLDIVTDQYWYAGPNFSPHEIRAPVTFDPATDFCQSFAILPWDVDGDGYRDIVVAPHVDGDEMLWYRNPAGADVHWTVNVLAPEGAAGLETPIATDLFGDGSQVLLSSDARTGVLVWQIPGGDTTVPWADNVMIGPNFAGAGMAVHGIGAGDVNGDGKIDVLTSYGWLEATGDRAAWVWHAFAFGPDACSHMFAYDVDGDGLADVICARPHDYGLHMWMQHAPESGTEPTFDDVLVDGSISQMHAVRLDDLDGDGVPEIVSGKRWWAHGSNADPGVADPALLVYYAIHRDSSGVSYERHTIDDDSGVGTQFEIADVDGDGKRDIVVSNKKGLFFFKQR